MPWCPRGGSSPLSPASPSPRLLLTPVPASAQAPAVPPHLLDQQPLTGVLVRPRRLSDLPALHRRLNVSPATQGVLPSAVLLGIFNVVGLVEDVLGIVLAIAAVVVFLSLFVSMYAAAFERRREIATMRALGARRATVFAIVLLESVAIALAGAVAGIAGGHGAAYLGAQLLAARGGPVTHPFAVGLLQPAMLAAAVAIGALAGLVPARSSRIARRSPRTLRRCSPRIAVRGALALLAAVAVGAAPVSGRTPRG